MLTIIPVYEARPVDWCGSGKSLTYLPASLFRCVRASSLDACTIRFTLGVDRLEDLEDFMRSFIWLALAAPLLLVWIGSFVMYRAVGFLIHLLLIFAVISLAIHLFTGNRAK